MATIIFYSGLILPVLAACFFLLAQRYGSKAAYITLSWMPAVSFGLLMRFQRPLGHAPDVLFPVELALSLFLGLFGIALTISAWKRRQRCVDLAVASCVA